MSNSVMYTCNKNNCSLKCVIMIREAKKGEFEDIAKQKGRHYYR